MDQVSHVHRRTIGGQAPAQPWKEILQMPRSNVGKFLGGLDDGNDFAACEHIQAAGERSLFALRTLGQTADDAVLASKQAHGLRSLREVPGTNADRVVNDGGHVRNAETSERRNAETKAGENSARNGEWAEYRY